MGGCGWSHAVRGHHAFRQLGWVGNDRAHLDHLPKLLSIHGAILPKHIVRSPPCSNSGSALAIPAVELMDCGVGVVHWESQRPEVCCHCCLPHSYPASESQHKRPAHFLRRRRRHGNTTRTGRDWELARAVQSLKQTVVGDAQCSRSSSDESPITKRLKPG